MLSRPGRGDALCECSRGGLGVELGLSGNTVLLCDQGTAKGTGELVVGTEEKKRRAGGGQNCGRPNQVSSPEPGEQGALGGTTELGPLRWLGQPRRVVGLLCSGWGEVERDEAAGKSPEEADTLGWARNGALKAAEREGMLGPQEEWRKWRQGELSPALLQESESLGDVPGGRPISGLRHGPPSSRPYGLWSQGRTIPQSGHHLAPLGNLLSPLFTDR